MQYSYIDLLSYLLIYAFLGWTAEVLIVSIKDRELRNRGFFNMPFCMSYGVAMDILIVVLPTMRGHVVMIYLTSLAVSAAVTYLSGSLSKRFSRTQMWDYQENNLFGGDKRAFLFGLLQGLIFMLVALLVHPLFYLLMSLLPRLVKIIFCIVFYALLVYDFFTIVITMRKSRTREELDALLAPQMEGKRRLGERLTGKVWHRINKAYPNLSRMETPDEVVFAEGTSFDKLVWVFLIMALIGDWFETVFVWATTGVLMSRSSLIYGTFSIIWGFGAVILTVILQRLKDKKARYIFLSGCFLGGIYEYSCSVISEVVFQTTFWDYSDMPLNFGGRTNLLFCLFWGLLSVWWVKLAFPFISKYIERIPVVIGKVITWVLVVFFVLDLGVSGAALLRYVDRIEHPEAENAFIEFLDENYPDEMLEEIWPNLRLTE